MRSSVPLCWLPSIVVGSVTEFGKATWACWNHRTILKGGLFKLTRRSVRGITHLGGTILGTTNRGNPLRYPVTDENGQTREVDRTDYLVEALREHKIDALISIGGDGSLAIANALSEKGVRVIGVPKTIDNDLDKTVITFGFDTAVSFATAASTGCIPPLRPTAV